ncbi:MAG: chemotaxis protein [Thermogutta sp.]
MNKVANLLLEKEILLESGTNELEILVFDVGHYVFGVNVAKVREVLPAPVITHLPNAHPSIRGVFKLRDQVVPCVSLADYLGEYLGDEAGGSTCILTDLNQQQTAFLVDRVERIHRLSWEDVLAVPPLDDLVRTPVTALARCQDRLILMLDFEMILDQITEHYFRTEMVDNPASLPREKALILLVEDSPTVREAITQTLSSSGYSQLLVFENGKEAWQWLEQKAANHQSPESFCKLVIADIEMPQVDGLHLTKRIKGHPQMKQIPVLLYSSIITPENRRKGEAVGADAQVAKPDLSRVVEFADALIFNQGGVVSSSEQGLILEQTGIGETLPSSAGQDSASQRETTPTNRQPTPFNATESPSPVHPSVGSTSPIGAEETSKTFTSSSAASNGNKEVLSSNVNEKDTAGTQEMSRCALAKDQNAPPATDEIAIETNPPEMSNDASAADSADEASAADMSHDLDAESAAIGLRPNQIENEHLWNTFALELQHRWQTLSELRVQISRTEGIFEPAKNFDLVVDVARTLHTIKSAAMVVPVEIITRTTHALEGLIEAGSNRNEWPLQPFNRYCDWIEMFLNPVDQSWDSWLETGQYLAADLEQQGTAIQLTGGSVRAEESVPAEGK